MLVRSLVGWLVGGLVGWLVGSMVGWLVPWLVGETETSSRTQKTEQKLQKGEDHLRRISESKERHHCR